MILTLYSYFLLSLFFLKVVFFWHKTRTCGFSQIEFIVFRVLCNTFCPLKMKEGKEKQMYKRAMREKARVKYEQDGRQKARVKCVQVRREKARAKYEQEGRSMYKEKGREKRREEREEKARVKYLTESRDRGRVEYEQKAVRKLGSSASPSGRFEPPAKHYAASKVEK